MEFDWVSFFCVCIAVASSYLVGHKEGIKRGRILQKIEQLEDEWDRSWSKEE